MRENIFVKTHGLGNEYIVLDKKPKIFINEVPKN